MIHEYDFDRQLQMSYGVCDRLTSDVLLGFFPGAREILKRESVQIDKQGVDLWVVLDNGKRLAVDVKVREKDFGKDDLALEVWSVVENQVIGWSLDEKKQTDYILWFWKDTRKFCIVPFPLLVKAFQHNRLTWLDNCEHPKQRTHQNRRIYHSECVFVPRRWVWGSIYAMCNGVHPL